MVMRVEVSAPARLHLGDLDPFAVGRLGYAPILAIDKPRTIVEAEEADALAVQGPQSDEARVYAKRILEAYGIEGIKLTVKNTAPRHSGFGSTTQLCLAIGRAIAEAHSLNPTLVDLVKALKHTSTGGVYTFQLGGFVVAGGLTAGPDERMLLREKPLIPPLILHSDFPEDWRFVIVRPSGATQGLSGEAEERVFGRLKQTRPPTRLIHKGYFLLASKLLPALIEKNAEEFGKALTDIQTNVGRIYLPVQGSIYNPGSQWLVPILRRSGALGIGQSSWGPTVYAFIDSPEAAQRMAEKIRGRTGKAASVEVAAADNRGATSRALR